MEEPTNLEQEYLDGLGSWHSKDHKPLLSRAQLLENYRILEANKDTEYIKECNACIPEAEEFANEQFGAKGPGGTNIKANAEYARKWSRCFHHERDKLYRERKQNEPQGKVKP